jgi:hypothetical protein
MKEVDLELTTIFFASDASMGSVKRAEVEEEGDTEEEETCGRTCCPREPRGGVVSLSGPWVDDAAAW